MLEEVQQIQRSILAVKREAEKVAKNHPCRAMSIIITKLDEAWLWTTQIEFTQQIVKREGLAIAVEENGES